MPEKVNLSIGKTWVIFDEQADQVNIQADAKNADFMMILSVKAGRELKDVLNRIVEL